MEATCITMYMPADTDAQDMAAILAKVHMPDDVAQKLFAAAVVPMVVEAVRQRNGDMSDPDFFAAFSLALGTALAELGKFVMSRDTHIFAHCLLTSLTIIMVNEFGPGAIPHIDVETAPVSKENLN